MLQTTRKAKIVCCYFGIVGNYFGNFLFNYIWFNNVITAVLTVENPFIQQYLARHRFIIKCC